MNDKQSMYALCIGVPALIILALVLSYDRGVKWEQFQKDHNCKVIGKVSATVLYATGGKHSMYVPEKTVYLCDGGIQYTR